MKRQERRWTHADRDLSDASGTEEQGPQSAGQPVAQREVRGPLASAALDEQSLLQQTHRVAETVWHTNDVSIRFLQIINRANVRVIKLIKRCENFGFPLQAAHTIGISRELLRQDLDRHPAFNFKSRAR